MTWLVPLLPFLAPAFGAMVALLVQAFWPKAAKLNTGLAIAFFAAALVGSVQGAALGNHEALFGGMILPDHLFYYIGALLGLTGIVTLVVSLPYLVREGLPVGEFNALTGLAIAGAALMACANDLLSMFIGLEVLSISVYVLVGFRRTSVRGSEAALKYFLLGAFSAGLFLYGIAIMYGLTGTMLLPGIKEYFAQTAQPALLAYAAAGFMLAGMAFKLAAFPFHMWAPDAYEGAPTPVVGFMAVAVKLAAMAALLRLLYGVFWPVPHLWQHTLATVAVGTMIVGNLFALVQTNLKRLMAYSSMAHTGYLFIGLATLDLGAATGSAPAILFYLAAYALTTLAAFACLSYFTGEGEAVQEIGQLAGAGKRHPMVAVILTLSMLSLAGLPPTAGFFAKYSLFAAAFAQGQWGLALTGILLSVLSLAYYLRVVVALWMAPGESSIAKPVGFGAVKAVACYLGVAVLWLGVSGKTLPLLPGITKVVHWTREAIASLLA